MSALSEQEIFDCLADNLREAADAAEQLATINLKGPVYNKLRNCLSLVEGACRQASAWREDTRWLPIGMMMHEAHQRAGGWLRGHKDPVTGMRVTVAAGQKNRLFLMLAQNLRNLRVVVEKIRTEKTGRMGIILPDAPVSVRRIGAPVSMNGATLPKLILPPRMA